MAVSAAEQYLLELINRARLDPLSEAERYNLGLTVGLPPGTITGTAKQVLAHNTLLADASETHSDWMLANDIFAHEGAGGSSPGDRMAAAGYDFNGAWTWRENLAWSGTTGSLDLVAAIEGHHEGLYRSSGHRANTFAEDIREIGIAQVAGDFTQDGTTYNASMLTLNFARSGSDHYLTGVAYTDTDNDAFYDVGEADSGLTITAEGETTQTASAGGYTLGLRPDAAVEVRIADGGSQLAEVFVDLTDGNVKLDVVTDASGGLSLALSGSATLVSGIADARLLGVGDLDLTGSAAANVLVGNAGRNQLSGAGGNDELRGGGGADALDGGAGDDVLRGGEGRDFRWDSLENAGMVSTANADMLFGGSGDDRLHGQSGRDVLDGGLGDDRLTGGGGRDTFIFAAGTDRILDFDDNVDAIHLDGSALGLLGSDIDTVIAGGTVVDGDAMFDFTGGHQLRILDVSDLGILADDMVII